MNRTARVLALVFVLIINTSGLKCYTGLQVFGGTGSESKECEDSSDYCYNATASAGSILNIAKAGCSTFRCYFSQNKCVNTDIQGVPVSFCCCNTEDLCNGRD